MFVLKNNNDNKTLFKWLSKNNTSTMLFWRVQIKFGGRVVNLQFSTWVYIEFYFKWEICIQSMEIRSLQYHGITCKVLQPFCMCNRVKVNAASFSVPLSCMKCKPWAIFITVICSRVWNSLFSTGGKLVSILSRAHRSLTFTHALGVAI